MKPAITHGSSPNMDPGCTPAQGRVLYHMERIFRSTGGGLRAHDRWLALCGTEGLAGLVTTWTRDQCVRACQLIEQAARDTRADLFRDCRTDWQSL